jgi:hypothetical protein
VDNPPPNLNLPPDREALLRARNWSHKIHDPESTTAAVEHDPALRALQLQSETFNTRVHQALSEIPVPPALRDQILARRKIIAVPFWRTPRALSLAAALAFLATGLVFLMRAPREDKTFAGFRSRMVAFALREYRMDIHTNDLAAVQTFLAQNGAPAEFNLPPGLAQTPIKGGAALTWQGKPVSMVCFDRLNTTLYMFVVDSSTTLPKTEFDIAPFKNISTAAWTAGDKTFFLAAPVPLTELETLLKS